MKKLISVLLAFTMALTLVSQSALAAGTTLTVNVPDTLPKAGETFTVTVDISGNPGLCAVQFTLGFDKSVVECTKAKQAACCAARIWPRAMKTPRTAHGSPRRR